MRFLQAVSKPALFSAALLSMICTFPAISFAAGDVVVSEAYAFAIPEKAVNAAAFMTLTYPMDQADQDVVPDRILRAESPIAEKVELHTMQIDENNVMQMRPVASIPLPPTGSFKLTPQGVHVMFLGVNRPLKTGDDFPLTMVFEKTGPVETTVTVRDAGDIPEDDIPHDHNHDHNHGSEQH